MQNYWNLSPLDGRYGDKTESLRTIASEAALNRYRYTVEIRWLLHMDGQPALSRLIGLTDGQRHELLNMLHDVRDATLLQIKKLEAVTNHDVKAVEYCLQGELRSKGFPETAVAFLHFACTSEDINNLSYALMLRDFRDQTLLPAVKSILDAFHGMIAESAAMPMMARTHGQPATPTTLGKELAVFAHRIRRKHQRLKGLEILGKFNGATGNYNAHFAAFPEVDWLAVARDFVEIGLGLNFNPLTTQIENHDNLAEWCYELASLNTILIDFVRDAWGYISLGYFRQKVKKDEIGSSTMPHKVNPIDFENAEGNFGIANALLLHLAEKLPVSRWQRDLSDSTVLRTLGTCWGHAVLGYSSLLKGIGKLQFAPEAMASDLAGNPELLAEAVQTLLRKHGNSNAYELLKEATRGKRIDKAALLAVVDLAKHSLPVDERNYLAKLEPATYLGMAEKLARSVIDGRVERGKAT